MGRRPRGSDRRPTRITPPGSRVWVHVRVLGRVRVRVRIRGEQPDRPSGPGGSGRPLRTPPRCSARRLRERHPLAPRVHRLREIPHALPVGASSSYARAPLGGWLEPGVTRAATCLQARTAPRTRRRVWAGRAGGPLPSSGPGGARGRAGPRAAPRAVRAARGQPDHEPGEPPVRNIAPARPDRIGDQPSGRAPDQRPRMGMSRAPLSGFGRCGEWAGDSEWWRTPFSSRVLHVQCPGFQA